MRSPGAQGCALWRQRGCSPLRLVQRVPNPLAACIPLRSLSQKKFGAVECRPRSTSSGCMHRECSQKRLGTLYWDSRRKHVKARFSVNEATFNCISYDSLDRTSTSMKTSPPVRTGGTILRVIVVGDTCVSEQGIATIVARDKLPAPDEGVR